MRAPTGLRETLAARARRSSATSQRSFQNGRRALAGQSVKADMVSARSKPAAERAVTLAGGVFRFGSFSERFRPTALRHSSRPSHEQPPTQRDQPVRRDLVRDHGAVAARPGLAGSPLTSQTKQRASHLRGQYKRAHLEKAREMARRSNAKRPDRDRSDYAPCASCGGPCSRRSRSGECRTCWRERSRGDERRLLIAELWEASEKVAAIADALGSTRGLIATEIRSMRFDG